MQTKKLFWQQRLASGICALALVSSLAAYRQDVMVDPQQIVKSHWEAIAMADLEKIMELYQEDAVLSYLNKVYQGDSIEKAWTEFFSNYKIEEFRVLETKRSDRTFQANIALSTRNQDELPFVFTLNYQVELDSTGKIIKEIWRLTPDQAS